MRTIIVGQAPGPRTDSREPLSGQSGRRLAALCGMELDEFLAAFERVNLIRRWPGEANGKGDAFPMARARRAAVLRAGAFPGARVVLLGRQVAHAFDVYGMKILEWHSTPAFTFALCPHPSGVCQWWNEPANVRRARKFWREAARRL